MVALKIAESIV